MNDRGPQGLPLPTVEQSGKRRWLYPDRRPGPRARVRLRLALVLMAFYIGLPWLTLGGQPLLRLDMLNQRLFLAGLVLSFSEIHYMVFVALAGAFGLLLATSIKGRIWCGFACPQTVFLDWLIRPIEELLEGKAHHRRVMDQRPLTGMRLVKKIIKHGIYFVFASVIANTLLAYFIDPFTLWHWNTSPPWEHPIGFGVASIAALLLYFDFAWFREQFCTFLCPYARFQSVLIDSRTPVISYDFNRGEPRGKKNSGDCIDCGHCIRVCPTGIDIRHGLQLECIQCTRCADACDAIMGNLGRNKGLIRFASEIELTRVPSPRSKRVILYGIGLTIAFSTLTALIYLRKPMSLVFIRAPGQTYVELAPGKFSNQFNVHAINRTSHEAILNLTTEFPFTLICGACSVPFAPFEDRTIPVVIVASNGTASGLPTHAILRDTTSDASWQVPMILP